MTVGKVLHINRGQSTGTTDVSALVRLTERVLLDTVTQLSAWPSPVEEFFLVEDLRERALAYGAAIQACNREGTEIPLSSEAVGCLLMCLDAACGRREPAGGGPVR